MPYRLYMPKRVLVDVPPKLTARWVTMGIIAQPTVRVHPTALVAPNLGCPCAWHGQPRAIVQYGKTKALALTGHVAYTTPSAVPRRLGIVGLSLIHRVQGNLAMQGLLVIEKGNG
jgi:hypothetical protein